MLWTRRLAKESTVQAVTVRKRLPNLRCYRCAPIHFRKLHFTIAFLLTYTLSLSSLELGSLLAVKAWYLGKRSFLSQTLWEANPCQHELSRTNIRCNRLNNLQAWQFHLQIIPRSAVYSSLEVDCSSQSWMRLSLNCCSTRQASHPGGRLRPDWHSQPAAESPCTGIRHSNSFYMIFLTWIDDEASPALRIGAKLHHRCSSL